MTADVSIGAGSSWPSVSKPDSMLSESFSRSSPSPSLRLLSVNDSTSLESDGVSMVTLPGSEQHSVLDQARQESNHYLQQLQLNLQFQFDLGQDGSFRCVKLLDPSTHQVVAQYPSDTILAIRDQISTMMKQNVPPSHISAGLLFSKTA